MIIHHNRRASTKQGNRFPYCSACLAKSWTTFSATCASMLRDMCVFAVAADERYAPGRSGGGVVGIDIAERIAFAL